MKTFLQALLRTDSHGAPAVARVVLGLAILPHGAQKALGWFGGYGYAGTMQWFTETMHVPWLLAFTVIAVETLGGISLIVGYATRLAALALAAVFVTAVALVHAQHGFFINWFGNQKGEGVEYFALALALAALVVRYGAGPLSVDRWLAARLRSRASSSGGLPATAPRPVEKAVLHATEVLRR